MNVKINEMVLVGETMNMPINTGILNVRYSKGNIVFDCVIPDNLEKARVEERHFIVKEKGSLMYNAEEYQLVGITRKGGFFQKLFGTEVLLFVFEKVQIRRYIRDKDKEY